MSCSSSPPLARLPLQLRGHLHLFNLLVVLLSVLDLALAFKRQVPHLRELTNEAPDAHPEVFSFVHVERNSGPVRLPWLRTMFIKSEKDRSLFKQAYLRQTSSKSSQNPKAKVADGGGMFAGHQNFNRLLTKDLGEGLVKDLLNCSLATMGGYMPNNLPWKRPDLPVGNVWIFVNGETSMGWQFWEEMKELIMPGDKGVILGNWWNETHETYVSPEVVSLWVPFASTSFAERRYFSPMDLYDRARRVRFDHEREHLVAYQQGGCNAEREFFWDVLNMAIAYHLNGTKGSYIGKCNGYKKLGEKVDLPDGYLEGPYPYSSHMDSSVGRYEHFRFVWAAEHGENRHGYITEKIVNAYLAGTVPVYAGAARSQLEQVFEPGTYIEAGVRSNETMYRALDVFVAAATNASLYEHILRRSQPVVSESAMRKFFSWHPDVFSHFGDFLRQIILRRALQLCHSRSKMFE